MDRCKSVRFIRWAYEKSSHWWCCRLVIQVGGASESDDLQSLSGAFLISGARSVVASLWKVDDDATQALMTRFYDNLITKKMTVAASLSDAQAYIRQQPEWAAPKYWAAFVLVGLPT